MMEANQRVIKHFAHRDALSSATASSAILLTLEAVKDMQAKVYPLGLWSRFAGVVKVLYGYGL